MVGKGSPMQSQTAAANILSSAVSDLRGAPVPRPTPSPVQSALYLVTIPAANAVATPTPQIRYFDSEGRCSTDLAGSTQPDGSPWSPAIQTRYRLTITFPQQSPAPTPPALPTTYGYLKVTWPAAADPAASPTPVVPSGSAEMFAAFDRN